MPFDHIVVVMMENHSFDNVLGALSRSGQAAADGLSFDGSPPNGTIFDRLDAHGISWHDYFTDLPGTVVIPAIIGKHLTHLRTIGKFYEDCAAGTLPGVSFVDPEAGLLAYAGTLLAKLPVLGTIGAKLETHGGDEEDPQDMRHGEVWAHRVVEAVLGSPAWPRTLLVYTYDEHGGYYDHVPPADAIAPDSIPPKLSSTDVPGGYDIYGPRVPAVVASPYSKPNAATNVVHDHTSVLATIEAKWNLPALTYRDANAATVMDFLDPDEASLLTPPTIQGPSDTGPPAPA